MEVLHTILTVIQVILAVALTIVVIAQSGKSEGLGAVSGSTESFMSKNQGSTLDAKLAKMTKWFAIAFMVLTFALNLFPTVAKTPENVSGGDVTITEEHDHDHDHDHEEVVEGEVEAETETEAEAE